MAYSNQLVLVALKLSSNRRPIMMSRYGIIKKKMRLTNIFRALR